MFQSLNIENYVLWYLKCLKITISFKSVWLIKLKLKSMVMYCLFQMSLTHWLHLKLGAPLEPVPEKSQKWLKVNLSHQRLERRKMISSTSFLLNKIWKFEDQKRLRALKKSSRAKSLRKLENSKVTASVTLEKTIYFL